MAAQERSGKRQAKNSKAKSTANQTRKQVAGKSQAMKKVSPVGKKRSILYKSRHNIGNRTAAERVGSYKETEVAVVYPEGFWEPVQVENGSPMQPQTNESKPPKKSSPKGGTPASSQHDKSSSTCRSPTKRKLANSETKPRSTSSSPCKTAKSPERESKKLLANMRNVKVVLEKKQEGAKSAKKGDKGESRNSTKKDDNKTKTTASRNTTTPKKASISKQITPRIRRTACLNANAIMHLMYEHEEPEAKRSKYAYNEEYDFSSEEDFEDRYEEDEEDDSTDEEDDDSDEDYQVKEKFKDNEKEKKDSKEVKDKKDLKDGKDKKESKDKKDCKESKDKKDAKVKSGPKDKNTKSGSTYKVKKGVKDSSKSTDGKKSKKNFKQEGKPKKVGKSGDRDSGKVSGKEKKGNKEKLKDKTEKKRKKKKKSLKLEGKDDGMRKRKSSSDDVPLWPPPKRMASLNASAILAATQEPRPYNRDKAARLVVYSPKKSPEESPKAKKVPDDSPTIKTELCAYWVNGHGDEILARKKEGGCSIKLEEKYQITKAETCNEDAIIHVAQTPVPAPSPDVQIIEVKAAPVTPPAQQAPPIGPPPHSYAPEPSPIQRLSQLQPPGFQPVQSATSPPPRTRHPGHYGPDMGRGFPPHSQRQLPNQPYNYSYNSDMMAHPPQQHTYPPPRHPHPHPQTHSHAHQQGMMPHHPSSQHQSMHQGPHQMPPAHQHGQHHHQVAEQGHHQMAAAAHSQHHSQHPMSMAHSHSHPPPTTQPQHPPHQLPAVPMKPKLDPGMYPIPTSRIQMMPSMGGPQMHGMGGGQGHHPPHQPSSSQQQQPPPQQQQQPPQQQQQQQQQQPPQQQQQQMMPPSTSSSTYTETHGYVHRSSPMGNTCTYPYPHSNAGMGPQGGPCGMYPIGPGGMGGPTGNFHHMGCHRPGYSSAFSVPSYNHHSHNPYDYYQPLPGPPQQGAPGPGPMMQALGETCCMPHPMPLHVHQPSVKVLVHNNPVASPSPGYHKDMKPVLAKPIASPSPRLICLPEKVDNKGAINFAGGRQSSSKSEMVKSDQTDQSQRCRNEGQEEYQHTNHGGKTYTMLHSPNGSGGYLSRTQSPRKSPHSIPTRSPPKTPSKSPSRGSDVSSVDSTKRHAKTPDQQSPDKPNASKEKQTSGVQNPKGDSCPKSADAKTSSQPQKRDSPKEQSRKHEPSSASQQLKVENLVSKKDTSFEKARDTAGKSLVMESLSVKLNTSSPLKIDVVSPESTSSSVTPPSGRSSRGSPGCKSGKLSPGIKVDRTVYGLRPERKSTDSSKSEQTSPSIKSDRSSPCVRLERTSPGIIQGKLVYRPEQTSPGLTVPERNCPSTKSDRSSPGARSDRSSPSGRSDKSNLSTKSDRGPISSKTERFSPGSKSERSSPTVKLDRLPGSRGDWNFPGDRFEKSPKGEYSAGGAKTDKISPGNRSDRSSPGAKSDRSSVSRLGQISPGARSNRSSPGSQLEQPSLGFRCDRSSPGIKSGRSGSRSEDEGCTKLKLLDSKQSKKEGNPRMKREDSSKLKSSDNNRHKKDESSTKMGRKEEVSGWKKEGMRKFEKDRSPENVGKRGGKKREGGSIMIPPATPLGPHCWKWEGEPEMKKVFVPIDAPPVERKCFPAVRHLDGDIIQERDCVLVKSGPRKKDIPFVAKIAALWEHGVTREMMMSILWYYRPEHTESERLPNHVGCEIFASKHRDETSVACIDDKCYILTFNEYCRYRAEVKRVTDGCLPRPRVIPDPEQASPPTKQRLPPLDADPETVFLCRRVYDFKLKRILKNPT